MKCYYHFKQLFSHVLHPSDIKAVICYLLLGCYTAIKLRCISTLTVVFVTLTRVTFKRVFVSEALVGLRSLQRQRSSLFIYNWEPDLILLISKDKTDFHKQLLISGRKSFWSKHPREDRKGVIENPVTGEVSLRFLLLNSNHDWIELNSLRVLPRRQGLAFVRRFPLISCPGIKMAAIKPASAKPAIWKWPSRIRPGPAFRRRRSHFN